MAKRKLEKEFIPSEISEAAKECTVHAKLTDLSPIKAGKSTKYFVAHCSDGTKTCRMVGFDEAKLRKLEQYKDNGKTVKFKNISAKNRAAGEIELFINEKSEITESDLDIQIPTTSGVNKILTLKQAKENMAADFTAHVRVLKSKETRMITTVHGEVKKQEIILADESERLKLVLWGNNCDVLEEGQSVVINKLKMKKFNKELYCAFTDFTNFTKAAEVKVMDAIKSTGEVITAKTAKSVNCMKCGGIAVPLQNALFSKCENCKCTLKTKSAKQSVTAEIQVNAKDGSGLKNIAMDGKEIAEVTGCENIWDMSEEEIDFMLLSVENFSY